MQRSAAVVVLCAISVVISGSAQQRNAYATLPNRISGSAGQLVGTWRLISRVVTLEDGTVIRDPGLGKTPSDYLVYDSSGHMAAQLMRPERPMAIDCGTSIAAPSENSQSVNGYDAYFGTYTIGETSHTVTHHLEGALAAADVGKNLVREFQLSGDKLTIIVRTNSERETDQNTDLGASTLTYRFSGSTKCRLRAAIGVEFIKGSTWCRRSGSGTFGENAKP